MSASRVGLFGRFLAWLRGFFAPRPVLRDVSRLDPATGARRGGPSRGTDAGETGQEEIVTAPVPWKEGSRRRIFRDPRLLPKQRTRFSRPPKVLEKAEARRLFAGTLRSRNRKIRDLLADEAQLERLGLPVWRTEADLAGALGITVGMLRHLSIHRFREHTPHYVQYAIPKRSGGERLIAAPKRRLKAVLRRLNTVLVSKLPLAEPAHGFREGRSIKTGALPHVGKAVVARVDLRDFFHQVTYVRVRGYLIACGYGFPVAATIAALCTEAERQPVEIGDHVAWVPVSDRRCVQGAPTSPGLCNAIAAKLDRRLEGLAKRKGFAYTRYADDLSFSGNDEVAIYGLVCAVSRICGEEGFPVNREKTKIMRRGRRQEVTGVVVNETLGLSRQDRRKLRAGIHHLKQGDPSVDRQQLVGKLGYLEMLNPEQARRLWERLRK